MEPLAFTDKTAVPNEVLVKKTLGNKKLLLDGFLSDTGINKTEWKFYGATSGWSLECTTDNKNLYAIQIAQKCFYVIIALSRQAKIKALADIHHENIKQAILHAKDYEDGTSVKLLVKNKKDIPSIMELLAIKIATF